MRKLRNLTGMPVVCGKRRIGRILRGELSEDLRQLRGIWIYAGLRGTRYIPVESLEMLGRVAVTADEYGKRGRMTSSSLLIRAVSTDGRRLGAINGADIDELSFAVTALELSAGFWDDLRDGRRQITRYTVNRQKGVVIIDPAGCEGRIETDEERNDEGADHRDADRWFRRDDVWRDELADGTQVEPEGQADGQLDLRKGR